MSDKVEIRLAHDDELDAVGHLTLDGYVHDGLLSVDAEYAAELVDAAHRSREAELLVAVVDGEVVGTVTFCPPGSPLRELSRDGEAEFRMLAVSPAARGRGVARSLVERCVARSLELGLAELVICSMREMTTAHRLYERLGFVRDPALDWTPVPDVVLLAYRRNLQPDAAAEFSA
ncbi:MAG: GNAT family N-acetyltransferase [Nocardioidaceae bacterium]